MDQAFFDSPHEAGERIFQASHLLLCVDYDGTLTHFAASPLGATLSPQMQRVLLELAENEHVSLAFISGRDRADLQGRVEIPGAIYVGNHGLEISGPGFLFVEPTAAARTETLQELATELTRTLEAIPDALVEYKGLTVSVHYRQVADEARDAVRDVVEATLARAIHPFVLTKGKKVYEIRPRVSWNKGAAVHWIQQQLDKPEMLTIYVGDDVTDEDAFKALPDGITIKVRPSEDTAAQYRLEGPAEVRKFLEWVDDLLRQKAQRAVPQEQTV